MTPPDKELDAKEIRDIFDKIQTMILDIQMRADLLQQVLGEAHVLTKLPDAIRDSVERSADRDYRVCNDYITATWNKLLTIMPKGKFLSHEQYDMWRVDDTIFCDTPYPRNALVLFYWHESDNWVVMSAYQNFDLEMFPIKRAPKELPDDHSDPTF